MWAPSRALLSAHSGYSSLAWGDIQNTLTTDEVNAGKAKDPNGIQNNDHPKVYVSWSKHAHFDTRNTGWNDPASQSLENAFRSQDWWHFVDPQNYVCPSTSRSVSRADNSRSERMIAPMPGRRLELQTGEVQVVTRLLCSLACVTPLKRDECKWYKSTCMQFCPILSVVQITVASNAQSVDAIIVRFSVALRACNFTKHR